MAKYGERSFWTLNNFLITSPCGKSRPKSKENMELYSDDWSGVVSISKFYTTINYFLLKYFFYLIKFVKNFTLYLVGAEG